MAFEFGYPWFYVKPTWRERLRRLLKGDSDE